MHVPEGEEGEGAGKSKEAHSRPGQKGPPNSAAYTRSYVDPGATEPSSSFTCVSFPALPSALGASDLARALTNRT